MEPDKTMKLDVKFVTEGTYSMEQLEKMLTRAGFKNPNCYSIEVARRRPVVGDGGEGEKALTVERLFDDWACMKADIYDPHASEAWDNKHDAVLDAAVGALDEHDRKIVENIKSKLRTGDAQRSQIVDQIAWLIYRANTNSDVSDEDARQFWRNESNSYRDKIERLASQIFDLVENPE